MPCYRCGVRQTDPARGPSPWKRGVVRGELVLVCPECQHTHDWVTDLDRCPSCGSTSLARALGETTCKSCGAVVAGDGGSADTAATSHEHGSGERAAGLAADVDAALAKNFHRTED